MTEVYLGTTLEVILGCRQDNCVWIVTKSVPVAKEGSYFRR